MTPRTRSRHHAHRERMIEDHSRALHEMHPVSREPLPEDMIALLRQLDGR